MRRCRIKSVGVGIAAWLYLLGCQGEGLADYVAGRHYFGTSNYVEYVAGNAPVVLSVPHGGDLTPPEIPDRTRGTLLTDRNTDKLAHAFIEAFHGMTGRYPHVILCRLKRTKIDANREIGEGAQGNTKAELAWREWHAFIKAASDSAVGQFGAGLYIDLHGHVHAVQRLELGYSLSASTLKLSDLEIARHKERSSIRPLADMTDASFAEVLRGPASFGALMAARGFPCVPSPQYPHANGLPYFSGGYNTRQHAGVPGSRISGFQMECNFKGVRDTDENRKRAATAMAESVILFLAAHYEFDVNRLTKDPLTAVGRN